MTSSGDLVIKKGRDRGLEGWTFEEEGQWLEPYFFVQGSDTQFGMIESFKEDINDVETIKTGGWQAEIELLSALIAKINAMRPKPKFFVICGDLVDSFPWDDPRREEQEKDFKKTLTALDPSIPVVCVCGNHDVGDRPTPKDVKRYTDEFGDDYFEFWVAGVHFVVVNSQYYKDPSLVPVLAKEQESWLNKTLSCPPSEAPSDGAPSEAPQVNDDDDDSASSARPRHRVAFMHIPPFLADPEEPDDLYFNLPSERRTPLLRKLYRGGIRKIFCGHYHRNAGGRAMGDLEVIVTSAVGAQLGKDVSGARIVRVLDEDIRHQYFAINDLPDQIDLSA